MSAIFLQKEIVNKFNKMGKDKFNRFLVTYCLNKLINMEDKTYNGIVPHIELLNYHDKMLSLYRSENNDVYLDIANSFRKIAHKIYRISLKKGLTEKDRKFLNAV